jgi:2',3'-cyclic-nucleotide 2'-phosphodiesterase (5'-nucleotidase family)
MISGSPTHRDIEMSQRVAVREPIADPHGDGRTAVVDPGTQYRSDPGGGRPVLQISEFRFTDDVARPAGARVVSVSVNDGTPILADSATYTETTNDFTNAGGDGYTMADRRAGHD